MKSNSFPIPSGSVINDKKPAFGRKFIFTVIKIVIEAMRPGLNISDTTDTTITIGKNDKNGKNDDIITPILK